MAQLVAFGETPLRLSPPDNRRLERAREARLHADGVESNAMVAAHALGTRSLWTSMLPDSPLGQRVCSQVDARGPVTDVTWVDPEECRQGLVFRETARAPRESRHVHDRSNAAMSGASPGDFPMNRIQDADMLFTALGTAVLSQDAADASTALLRAGSGAGARTVVALDYATGLASPEVHRGVFEELAHQADIVVGTESDIQRVLGRDGRWRDLASHLTVEHNLDIAVVVRPGDGAVTIEDSERANLVHERETVTVDPVDTTGEFGALVGAFCNALLDSEDTAAALDTGLAASALARTIEGPFLTASADEVAAVLARFTDDRR